MNQLVKSLFVLACFAVVSPATGRPSTNITCGVVKEYSKMIVSGQSYLRGSYPWIVALLQNKTPKPSFFCGGTIISSTFVMSAAHCFKQKKSQTAVAANDVIAQFGAHHLKFTDKVSRFSLTPKRIIIQDDWNSSAVTFDGDISLIEFERDSIRFGAYVFPICLWSSAVEPSEMEGDVTLWSKNEVPKKNHENVRKQIKVMIQTNEDCLPGHGKLAELSSRRTFCAGLKNGSGICFGEGGGGLFIKVSNVYYLKGIVSSTLTRNDDCDISNFAVYTNVLKFKDWITKKLTGAVLEVYCTFKKVDSWYYGKLKTCMINQTIAIEEHILASPVNKCVEEFDISDNTEVKYLPRLIGEKFPNLKEFFAMSCGLTVIRDFYFKEMQNLQFLTMPFNKISTIEHEAFRDLVNVERLYLNNNLIETFHKNLFAKMVKLQELFIDNNKIKLLDPTIFQIPGEKLEIVNLESNVCIDGYYGRHGSKFVADLENDIWANCTK